jgi:biopolymer transport protein ExbD
MAGFEENDDEILASINVTPLVDIFLVLLIIFMIASSILNYKEIPVNIPKASHAGSDALKACGLIIDKNSKLYLDGVPMDSIRIIEKLRAIVATDTTYRVLISADEDLPYRKIVACIDMMRASGINKYALKVLRPR